MKAKLQLLVSICILLSFTKSYSQTATLPWTPGGDKTLSATTASWTGGTAPTSPGTYTEDVTFGSVGNQMGNNDILTIDISITINGNVNFNANAHTTIHIPSGVTLTINGNLTDATNNVTFDVSGTLVVTGTLTSDNNAVFEGSGSISGGTLALGNNAACGAGGCPDLHFNTCTDGNSGFCLASVPITLLFMKASVESEKVVLRWATESEINFDHFVLERSNNGIQFSKLDVVRGSGNSSSRKDYSYTDHNPLIGNSYYRLTSIDFDGYTEVFNNRVVRVTNNAGKNFFIVPNPIERNKLKGGINFDASNVHVIIYDRMGVVVDRHALIGTEFELQLPNLANGVYFAQLQGDGYTKTVRFSVNQ